MAAFFFKPHISASFKIWLVVLGFAVWVSAGSARAEQITNGMVTVRFDTDSGVWSVLNARTGEVVLEQAKIQLNQTMLDSDLWTYRVLHQQAQDCFGQADTMLVQADSPGQPTLGLEFRLYPGQTFVSFRLTLENRSDEPYRIKQWTPMQGARLFHNQPETSELYVLDGYSGAGPNHVSQTERRFSPNNAVVVLKTPDHLRSAVLGGLSYQDFAKYCLVGDPPERPARAERLAELLNPGEQLLDYLNCGKSEHDRTVPDGPKIIRQQGDDFAFPLTVLKVETDCLEVAFHKKEVVYDLLDLDPDQRYMVGITWWDYDHNARVQTVLARAEGREDVELLAQHRLPAWEGLQQLPESWLCPLPPESYSDRSLQLVVRQDLPELNAVVSEVWLVQLAPGTPPSSEPRLETLLLLDEAPLSTADLNLHLYAEDPVGKLVLPGQHYQADDWFYLDLFGEDPFQALEDYGRCLRTATAAAPNIYDFPTVCLWYAMHHVYGGGPAQNNSVGAVQEMERIADSGFLRYSRAAVRLVPDTYDHNNQQGWWDDEHWQKYGWQPYMFRTMEEFFPGFHYQQPYETSRKWAAAVTERGGLPFTYIQTGIVSRDYAETFPDHMVFNASSSNHYDYTDPGFVKHIQSVWRNLQQAGVRGVMFDYPETGWVTGGGFEDPTATTAAAYRRIFELARQGLGTGAWLHERNVGDQPFVDVTAGVVDSQRIWGDTDHASMDMYTRCGLRWYKNRLVYTYDMDSKSLAKTVPANRDGVRQMLTMVYVTGGRFLLGQSFAKLTEENLWDLSRIFPMHTTAQSARPIDAFTGRAHPLVYDFPVNPDWHQVTLLNPHNESTTTLRVSLADTAFDGGLSLKANEFYLIYDFWNDRFLDRLPGNAVLEQTLRPGEARMLACHRDPGHPRFISTNRHIMQGYLELSDTVWDSQQQRYRGTAQVVAGEPLEIVLWTDQFEPVEAVAEGALAWLSAEQTGDSLAKLVLLADCSRTVDWSVSFRPTGESGPGLDRPANREGN